ALGCCSPPPWGEKHLAILLTPRPVPSKPYPTSDTIATTRRGGTNVGPETLHVDHGRARRTCSIGSGGASDGGRCRDAPRRPGRARAGGRAVAAGQGDPPGASGLGRGARPRLAEALGGGRGPLAQEGPGA